jgi:hypothetical protein
LYLTVSLNQLVTSLSDRNSRSVSLLIKNSITLLSVNKQDNVGVYKKITKKKNEKKIKKRNETKTNKQTNIQIAVAEEESNRILDCGRQVGLERHDGALAAALALAVEDHLAKLPALQHQAVQVHEHVVVDAIVRP